jgi:hypothetical protein
MSIKGRLKRLSGWMSDRYVERVESSIYQNKRTKRIKWEARLMPLVLIGCCIGYDLTGLLPLLWPMVWYGISGAAGRQAEANAFKVGWFSGRSDMGVSLIKNMEAHQDVYLGVRSALREANERNLFAIEGLGIGKPEPVKVPESEDEDDEQ